MSDRKGEVYLKLRQMAVAFLFNKNQDVLFLQKKLDNSFLPGLLVPIGGHIEKEEMGDPNKACLREIEEETGLVDTDINNLMLRYVVLRMKGHSEIRIQYVYFGNVIGVSKVTESEEGQLYWKNFNEVLSDNVTETTKEIVKHYDEIGQFSDQVYVGTMKSDDGTPKITWAILEDWDRPIK